MNQSESKDKIRPTSTGLNEPHVTGCMSRKYREKMNSNRDIHYDGQWNGDSIPGINRHLPKAPKSNKK